MMGVVAGQAAVDRSVELLRGACAAEGMPVVVAAIDGIGGAGKSTLAARIAHLLERVSVIHTDDFASWEDPVGWWPRLLSQVLRPLADGRPARYQRYDWERQALAEWHEVPVTDYLLIEGVGSSRREFRPYLAVSVWVATGREECLQRGLARDGAQARDLWVAWQAAEDDYIADHEPERAADLIVSGENGSPWEGPQRPDKSV